MVIRETRKPNEAHVKGAVKAKYDFSTKELVFGTQYDSIRAPKDVFFLTKNNRRHLNFGVQILCCNGKITKTVITVLTAQ